MRKLTRDEREYLWMATGVEREVAERMAEKYMDDETAATLIQDYLETVGGEEARLCVKWQKIWKVMKSKVTKSDD